MQLPLPDVASKSLDLIGTATSGVALFALGLVLSGQRLRVGKAALLNVVFKIALQPAAMWLLAVLLGVTGVYRREMILLGALPTAMFAVQYDVYVTDIGRHNSAQHHHFDRDIGYLYRRYRVIVPLLALAQSIASARIGRSERNTHRIQRRAGRAARRA